MGLTQKRGTADRSEPGRKGSFVLIVGPDGTGKSTLALGLVNATKREFPNVVHMHWRPGLLPRPGGLMGIEAGDPSDPHAREPHGSALSFMLLTYHWLDFFLGSWLRIVPVRARGGLIVMERGWPDIAVDPRRYHLALPSRLVERLGRLLPAPDLVIVLQADPEALTRRKAELPPQELSRQIARWREISFPRRTTRLFFDALQSPEQLLDQLTRLMLVP